MSTPAQQQSALGWRGSASPKRSARPSSPVVYQPDELVPGEIELCRRYGASRTVVREAFKLLSAKGLIASRKRTRHARPGRATPGTLSMPMFSRGG